MLKVLKPFVPTITNMIRADHTHVLATFHQYEIDTSPGTKKALVNTICLALEIHAQLECATCHARDRSGRPPIQTDRDRITILNTFYMNESVGF